MSWEIPELIPVKLLNSFGEILKKSELIPESILERIPARIMPGAVTLRNRKIHGRRVIFLELKLDDIQHQCAMNFIPVFIFENSFKYPPTSQQN